ncbi:MAG: cupin domain-containing protein [Prevotellaceae bacterium]|jgi:predicted cupin superfamily sugar epimerase|nr:cupin domain-containing protein [Prevotellaceae bacterium]
MEPSKLISELQLQPHPEGGYYRETYRSDETLLTPDGRIRNFSTAIYYLMCGDNCSHLHRIRSDEVWHVYCGEAVELVIIEAGVLRIELLGHNTAAGERPQAVAPRGAWFGARLRSGKGEALVGCTVSPGFLFEDFELGRPDDFRHLACYEQIKELIGE